MKNSWQFFIIIEALLFIFASYKLFQDPEILFVIILLAVVLGWAIKRRQRNPFYQFVLIVSSVIISVILLFNSPVIWLMLVIAVVFLGVKGTELVGIPFLGDKKWKQKEMIMVETVEPENKNGRRFKRKWFGNQRIGDTVYEWDDINMTILSGDTIIDLGNTLLPKEDSVIVIRKALGKTRLLVPVGIGVLVEHSAIRGEVHIDGQVIRLKNEEIKCYSDDYFASQRRLKVISNTFIGDLEVIRI